MAGTGSGDGNEWKARISLASAASIVVALLSLQTLARYLHGDLLAAAGALCLDGCALLWMYLVFATDLGPALENDDLAAIEKVKENVRVYWDVFACVHTVGVGIWIGAVARHPLAFILLFAVYRLTLLYLTGGGRTQPFLPLLILVTLLASVLIGVSLRLV